MSTIARDYVVTGSASIYQATVGSLAHGLRGTLDRWYRFALRCYTVGKQRHALANLTDEQLQDVGLTRGQALAEAGKPFWR